MKVGRLSALIYATGKDVLLTIPIPCQTGSPNQRSMSEKEKKKGHTNSKGRNKKLPLLADDISV